MTRARRDTVRLWFENTILEAHLDAVEGTLSEEERRTWTRQFPAGFDKGGPERQAIQAFRNAIGKHQAPEPPFVARVRQITLQDFQEISGAELERASKALLKAAAGFTAFRRELYLARLGTQFRLGGLDLLAPVLLAATALAHYVGDLGLAIAPSLSEVLLTWAT